MSGRSAKNNNRGSDLFGYFVSGKYKEFHTNQYAGIPLESGLTATGGVISDYTSGSDVYRAHIFTSSGTFEVTAPGSLGDTVEYLLVAGGGGGGFSPTHYGGGGGAGGLLSNHPDVPNSNPIGAIRQPSYTVAVGSYTVEIGAGGGAAAPGSVNGGVEGGNTNFYPTPVSYPSPTYLRAVGGGGGGARPAISGDPGGSGGGAGESTPSPGYGTGTTNQGTPGGYIGDGQFGPTSNGHGGGGALTAGNTKAVCAGGDGLQVRISGSPISEQPAGAPGPSPVNGYFAGGGAGAKNSPAAAGGFGGGGAGGAYNGAADGEFGTQSTGGGGGGGVVNDRAGGGGSGICIIRYQIGTIDTSDAKATGGAISFYNNHAIHTFTGSGTFANTSGSDITGVTYVCIGGGGAGGGAAVATNGQNAGGGGGGAGGYVTASGQTISTTPFPVSIGAGGSRLGGFELPAKPGSNTVVAFPGGTVTAGYGGGGGYANNGASGDAPLGSGGGSAGEASDPGTAGPQGNAGGTSGSVHGGGGGGAGGAGAPTAGNGGAGVQLPTVFQDPRQAPTQNIGSGGLGAPGPGSTKFWVAGGGGGGNYGSGTDGGTGGNAPQGDIRYAGAGSANYGMHPNYSPVDYNNAIANTGSGGGGISPHFSGGPQTNTDGTGGGGGSGLVLIAYPIA
jgi:hypothetical protein